MSRSLAQRRAEHALGKIKGLDDSEYGNYLSYVKALPATIIMTGLGQALAMEKAGATKDGSVGKGHRALYQHLVDWLGNIWPSSPYRRCTDLLCAITQKSEADYIRAQVEAMAYLEWLKKFAVAYLEKPANRGGD